MPHDVGLRVAMEQQERRSVPARARENAPGRGVEPMRGEARKEIGEISHDLELTLPRDRAKSDVAAAKAFGPTDAVDRGISACLRLGYALSARADIEHATAVGKDACAVGLGAGVKDFHAFDFRRCL